MLQMFSYKCQISQHTNCAIVFINLKLVRKNCYSKKIAAYRHTYSDKQILIKVLKSKRRPVKSDLPFTRGSIEMQNCTTREQRNGILDFKQKKSRKTFKVASSCCFYITEQHIRNKHVFLNVIVIPARKPLKSLMD